MLIESLIACVLLITLYLAYRSYKSTDEPAIVSGAHFSDIEETLKKLLEKASLVPAASSVSSAVGGAPAELLNEIETLRRGLEEKQAEIEKLKVSGGDSASTVGISADEKNKLENQLKELQGKLAEYEIISEDIADLSFYKEENTRLKKLLEQKAGDSATPAQAAPAVASAPVAQTNEAAASIPETAAQPMPASPVPEPIIVPAPPAVSPEVVVSQAAQAAPQPLAAEQEQDIMNEFEKAVEEQKTPDLGTMDMDKMLQEATGINETSSSTEGINALESGLNESKLLEEASALTEVKAEDKNLMNEFENFVKKGS